LHGRANVRRCPNALWGGLIDMLAQIVGHHRADELHGIVCLITPGDTLSIFSGSSRPQAPVSHSGQAIPLHDGGAERLARKPNESCKAWRPTPALDALHGKHRPHDRTDRARRHEIIDDILRRRPFQTCFPRAARRVLNGHDRSPAEPVWRSNEDRHRTGPGSRATKAVHWAVMRRSRKLVIARQCQRVIFFIDPRVTHEHEGRHTSAGARRDDRNPTTALCMTSPAMAARWAESRDTACVASLELHPLQTAIA